MTPPGGVEAAQTRAWQPGDRAWCDGAVWRREQYEDAWKRDDWSEWAELAWRTDAEMTAAGAVLVATADGPVGAEGGYWHKRWTVALDRIDAEFMGRWRLHREVADLRAKVNAVRELGFQLRQVGAMRSIEMEARGECGEAILAALGDVG